LKIDLRKTPEAINASRQNISRAVMEGAAELLNEKLNLWNKKELNLTVR